MGYKCCVVGCNSGYSTSKVEETSPRISYFAFPFDPVLCKKWIDQCHRKDFQPTKYSRVCSLHFVSADIVYSAKQCKLLPSAWPRLHPQLDSRFEKRTPTPRPTRSALSSIRIHKENDIVESKNNNLLLLDQVTDYQEFCSKINNTKLPNSFVSVNDENTCSFLLIEDVSKNPYCLASVLVSDDLSIKLFVNRKKLPISHVNHLLSLKGRISTMTEIANVLAYIKSIATHAASDHVTIEVAASLLESVVASGDIDEHAPLINFIVNQLHLISLSPNGRRYTNELIILSFIWKMTSNALYKKLSSLFLLPSIRQLQRLCGHLSVQTDKLDVSYMKTRVAQLKD
jgi:hypothetical protein